MSAPTSIGDLLATEESDSKGIHSDNQSHVSGKTVVPEPNPGLPVPDLERGQRQEESKTKEVDPNLVTWDGPSDPTNPMNWPDRRKWQSLFVVSCYNFIRYISRQLHNAHNGQFCISVRLPQVWSPRLSRRSGLSLEYITLSFRVWFCLSSCWVSSAVHCFWCVILRAAGEHTN
jgi:hypothetical protein